MTVTHVLIIFLIHQRKPYVRQLPKGLFTVTSVLYFNLISVVPLVVHTSALCVMTQRGTANIPCIAVKLHSLL